MKPQPCSTTAMQETRPAFETIWKFALQVPGETAIRLPVHSRILTAQFQGSELQLWALVNSDSDVAKVTRRIEVVGTGWFLPFSHRRDHVATVQEGALVWHVFDCGLVDPEEVGS